MKQSIPLAILLSSLNGLFCVMANFCLSYPDYLAKKGKKPWVGYKGAYGYWANFFFQNLSEVGSLATWFGPVALTVPVGLGSGLIFNILFYGIIAPINHFTKDMRVGTYVITVAIVLLPVDGPGAQENQDIAALLRKPLSMAWSLLMIVILFYTTLILCISDIKKYPSLKATIFLILSQGAAVVVANTTAKMFVIVRGLSLGVAIGLWLVASVSLTISSMVAATAVDQSKYVPVATSIKLMMNAVTGIIVWEDWKVVKSWTGYGCVFVLLLLGVYMLSAMDIFEHYDTLVEAGHAEAVGVHDPEYQPVSSDEEAAAAANGKTSKYGAVQGGTAAAAESSVLKTHKHEIFYRHKPWHMFKE